MVIQALVFHLMDYISTGTLYGQKWKREMGSRNEVAESSTSALEGVQKKKKKKHIGKGMENLLNVMIHHCSI